MSYCVYRHVFPNGKIYIGKAEEPATNRWQGGLGYEKSNRRMFIDIVKYGWDNITHEILADGLDETNALQMERGLIEKANLEDPKRVYNRIFAVKPEFVKMEERADKTIVGAADSASFVSRYVGDDWIDLYFDDGMYLNLLYEKERVVVIKVSGPGFKTTRWVARYPSSDMTVKRLKNWLWSGDAEFKKGLLVAG